MEKRNALLLIGIIALIIIIAGVLAYLFWPSEYKQVYDQQKADCLEQNKLIYATAMAKRTSDTSYCLPEDTADQKCIAFATKNPQQYCAGLDGDEAASCNAEVMQEASKCPKDDNWCLAMASGDPQFCSKLDIDDAEECKKLLPQNAEYWISEEANKECSEIATSAAESRMKLKSI